MWTDRVTNDKVLRIIGYGKTDDKPLSKKNGIIIMQRRIKDNDGYQREY